MISLSLPFPPSLSQCFTNVPKRGRVPTPRYKAWQEEAGWMVKAAAQTPLAGNVTVDIVFFPPDKRKRDLDNLFKPTLDLLVKHGLIVDDSKITDLRGRWSTAGGPEGSGALVTVRSA